MLPVRRLHYARLLLNGKHASRLACAGHINHVHSRAGFESGSQCGIEIFHLHQPDLRVFVSIRTLRLANGPDEMHEIPIAKNVLQRYHNGESGDFGN